MELKVNPNINKDAKRDIEELADRIEKFRNEEIDEDRFRAYRLARGVYGQRQLGVQMIRIKLPYGKFSTNQLRKIAEVSDKYATSNLHATTRQDIQLHYVKLDDAPQLWADLEEEGVTMREACGNTVRNVTGSYDAGISPEEPFDVTPYADAFYKYFLRNPICQEMGRKFKVAFTSGDDDNALTFMHDLGFIPKIKDGQRGFKVMVGGGLGAQPFHAYEVYTFLPADQIIPFSEAVLRVFDRHGERAKRNKARMKYMIKRMGIETFMKEVEEERPALKSKTYPIAYEAYEKERDSFEPKSLPAEKPQDIDKFNEWKQTNLYDQRQEGLYGVQIRLHRGDMDTDTTRKFADVVDEVADERDIRVTLNQGYIIRGVKEESLPYVFNRLNEIGLAKPGFNKTADITTCPGTDTCNLGIASSYGVTTELEKVLEQEYYETTYENDIKIKISGCMNSCGQHGMAHIGFHGMSMKKGEYVMPAMQVLLGGGIVGDGQGRMADKIIKMPSKRCPDALRTLLDDFENNKQDKELFNDYYDRQGKKYFYNLLKPYSEVQEVTQDLLIDWGDEEQYEKHVGVGECAGVMLDLVGTLLNEAEEKLHYAEEMLAKDIYADSIYHSYNVFIGIAKAMLTHAEINTNTSFGIIQQFDENFVQTGAFDFGGKSFNEVALKHRKNEPTKAFAQSFMKEARDFMNRAAQYRENKIKNAEKVEV